MWLYTSIVCLFVGLTASASNPAWKPNSEYVYKINGRSLASLHEVANQYSGIIYKAEMKIQPRKDEKLQCSISKAEYSQIHSHLADGWNSDIPESELSYKHLDLSDRSFQVEVRDGVIRDLIVNKDVPNWEANMIKSFVSQFQLNTNGVDFLPSKITAIPEEGENSAVFKTMEETVTGKTETMYDIHPMPEYILQSKPWLARHSDLKGDGTVIEVVKYKNYSNNEELPLYHYGFGETASLHPATNQMGDFFVRSSISRAILTGNLKRYVIQNSYTVNEIVMSPTLNNKQKGSVVSMVNVTLEEITSSSQPMPDVSNPVPLGNIVYTYDNSKSSSVSPKMSGSKDRHQRSHTMNRIRRAIQDYQNDENSSSSSRSSEEREFYQKDQPKLREAPLAPILPYTTGYKGMCIKHNPNVNVKKSVQTIAQDIGKDMQNPENVLKHNTLSKFITMTSIISVMDLQELKQVAVDLYSSSKNGPQRDTWTAFRDAVAECGTGPAFLTIQDWVLSGKVEDEEAAELITAAANSVREPTKDYLKSYFEFIKNSKIQSQEDLHARALLAYSQLVRKVCFDKTYSKRQYPVNSFGKFCTDDERKDIEKTVIPYFTQQLRNGVSRGNTHKIHTYIRALGNLAHPQILASFEPYLEGKTQVSQFQRLLMVVAMDKLTETHPKAARSVLYKIYQNVGESQEVRVAAVYQLMRTSPPTSMLQRMASYTNIDTQDHVNAAVKSSIEHAAEAEGEENQWIRSSAEAAKPLLTKKDYGVQHGQNHLHSYVIEELKLQYKHTLQYIGSDEEFYPKSFMSSIRYNLGGLTYKFATLQALVSSVDELVEVAKYQTAEYQEQIEKQKQNAPNQFKQKLSSLNIARLLDIKSDEREQLEGQVYAEFNDAIQMYFTFDNRSMEKLPEEIRKYEEEINNGKEYYYTKFDNSREMALSFPTEAGVPFLFTYDSPKVVKVQANIRGDASPHLSSDGKLQRPHNINFNIKLGFTVSKRTESRLSFTTPFDSKRYISGFDKNFQVHIPLYADIKMDLKNRQIEVEIENKEMHQGAKIFHYSTWPYTSKVDIKNFQPVSLQKDTYHIQQNNLRSYDQVVGKKQTGMALRIQMEHEREFINIPQLSELIRSRNIANSLLKLWDDAAIQYGQVNIQLLYDQCTTKQYVIRGSFEQRYESQSKQSPDANWNKYSSTHDLEENFIDSLGAGIKNARIVAWNASVQFEGDQAIQYSVKGGFGKSNVDPNSRVIIYYKQSRGNEKPYEASLQAESVIPNTNGLDLLHSLEKEPVVDTTINFAFGEAPSKVAFKFKWSRSDERKRYLQEQQMYKECQREMRDGNNQLPACANMTMTSNLLDRINVQVQHERIHEEVKEAIKLTYETLKFNYYPTLQVDEHKGTGQQGKLDLEARFDPDLRSVNISVKEENRKSTINNIQVSEWAKLAFVAHPVFHLRARIFGAALGLRTYRPICVVDQFDASTFNNRTYPVPFSNRWTLMMQYVPKEARCSDQQISVEDQLKNLPENYAVLVRQNSKAADRKDFKMTISSPRTDYKVTEITLTPVSQQESTGAKAKVMVNNEEVPVSDEQAHDIDSGYIEIYSLPNGEVKVEVEDAFYVIYDGRRAKLTVVNGKFRDSIRGLCGTFTDDRSDDFLTAENCIARDYKQFITSYEVEGFEGEQQRKQFSRRTAQCVPKDIPLYVNVISEQDTGKKEQDTLERLSKGTKFQTRYVEHNGEICFTIHPVPVCNNKRQQRSSYTKNVPVHCLQKSNVANLWKDQIDRGASPDFAHKKQSKTIQMELPKNCS